MSSLYSAHPADEIELGMRAELALRYSFLVDPMLEAQRGYPDWVYLIPLFFNHVACDARGGVTSPCQCTGCIRVRRMWT